MLAGAHFVIGSVLHGSGQFPAAREHLERSVELFGTSPSRNYGAFFAQAASNMLVAVLAILGYPSTAHGRADELLAASRRSSDPFSIATALIMNGFVHLPLRDIGIAAALADEWRVPPPSLTALSDAIAHAARSPFLNDMALSRAARAHIEVEQAIREAPAALRAEVARIAADAMNRVADTRHARYQTAYEMLDSLTARMRELKTH